MRTNHVQTEPAAAPLRAGRARVHGAGYPVPPADRLEALGLLIHGLSKTWREEMDRRLRPLGLTRVQWQALLWLSRAGGALSQRELSDLLRSEEHTSELQSRRDPVCRLLPEKRKSHAT